MPSPPRVRSMNYSNSDARPVFAPADNNKSRSKSISKSKPTPNNKSDDVQETATEKSAALSAPVLRKSVSSVSRQSEARVVLMRSNLSMSASCSSDASSDSFQSRGSTGSIIKRSVELLRKKQPQQCGERIQRNVENGAVVGEAIGVSVGDGLGAKKRCGWVTSNTDPIYAAFHDDEWGVPVHDDKKLFELLSLCTALAELTWPVILNRRLLFREVFHDFDPVAISKLNDKKIATAGTTASSLLSEVKLRAILENARQTCKIINELGTFDKYIWGFVNHKPIVGHFRYPRQVPIKTSKADAISKDLVRRGFRGIGPTVVYAFMQVAGITNDHLIGCFRFHDCIAANDATDKDDSLLLNKPEGKQAENAAAADLGIARDINDLSLC